MCSLKTKVILCSHYVLMMPKSSIGSLVQSGALDDLIEPAR